MAENPIVQRTTIDNCRPTDTTMRLLLIEDDHKMAAFILKGFKEAGYAVDHADNGEDGLHLMETVPYDAAVIDLMIPKMDGLSLIREVRKQHINTPVIILSAKQSLDDRVKGLEIGSDDYLTKPFSFSELLARVHALIRRASNVSDPTSLSIADLTMDLLTREIFRAGRKIVLQPIEYALLEYLLRNQNKVVTKTMIMEHVWDYNFDPRTNVVEARICKLREKIDKSFAIKLIHTVRGVGYIIREP